MPDHKGGGDDFWNLLAAYIESPCPDELLRNMDPALVEAVVRHVEECEDCQAQRRELREKRHARETNRNEGP